MGFNRQSRAISMLKTSGVGTVCHALNVVVGFVYRTAFIAILSERYLGINGLFWDLFGILALAELGIGSTIGYRFYKPIAENDAAQVARLMRFYRHVYLMIAGVVAALGLALYPFLPCLIRDASEVPADVNLSLVYFLFLAQSVSSYLFVYRLTIWDADRKSHVTIFTNMLTDTGRFGVQLLVLWLTRDFVWTIAAGLVFVVSLNFLLSVWTTRRYPAVFADAGDLPRAEKVGIFKDAGAMLLHRIGGTVVSSTDSIVLSKFAGLAAVGFYSNYAMLTSSLARIVSQMIGGFTSNYGNAYATLDDRGLYDFFRKMTFVNLAVSGFAAACLFLLVGPFVRLWLGERMCLGTFAEAVLCALFFMQSSTLTNNANIMASGLFVRDKPRPVIEAVLNVVISIALVGPFGIAGVFLGTIASSALTVFWRMPYLLFTLKFHRSTWLFWAQYVRLAALPAAFAFLVKRYVDYAPQSWLGWLAYACAVAGAYAAAFAALYGWTRDGRAFARLVREKFLTKFRKQ